MAGEIVQVSADFWNIRGSFKIGGVVDIGTQASLVRLADGNFLLLDACAIDDGLGEEIDGIVGDSEIEAIVHLHPFHTVHVQAVHARYPAARLHGTQRHLDRFNELWRFSGKDVELRSLTL